MKGGTFKWINEKYYKDICLGSRPEKVPPKKFSAGLGVTEELPLPQGVREELTQKNFFRYFMLSDS